MSARTNFPCTASLVAAGVVVTLALACPPAARAGDMVLQGPHPGLKENAVSVQFLYGSGLADSFSGRGLGVAYGLMLQGPLWLDLQMNFRASACGPFQSCDTYRGSALEIMPGISWRFRTDIPVVPIVRGAAGLVYLYPDGSKSAFGLAARGGIGLKYYVYDWLGFGIEAALSLGHGYFAQGYGGGRTYAIGDLAAGVEFQFR